MNFAGMTTRPLRECGRLYSGGTPSKSDESLWSGSLPWFSSKEIKSFELSDSELHVAERAASNGTTIVPAGTVLFVVRGMSLANEFRVGVTTRPATFNQDVKALVPASDVDGRYLARYLRWMEPQILDATESSTHGTKRLPTEAFDRLPIPLPVLEDQRRIAAILDKADAIRRQRMEAIALTEELLRSTFLEMFGDPVANPKSWPVRSITELCESKQYGTGEKANTEGNGQPVLRMNNLTYAGDIDLANLKWANLSARELAKLDLRDGDVLFNRVNSHELVGKTAVWHNGAGFTFAGYLIRLRMRPELAVGDYVASAMNMPSIKVMLAQLAKPSINMANISASDLDRLVVPLPPLDLQKKLSVLRRSVLALRDRYQQATKQDDALFDSLVARAFSGSLVAAC